MENWQEDQLNALLKAGSTQDFFSHLTSIAHDLGFDYCAYGLREQLPISQPRVITLNNYPAKWQEIYQRRNYLLIDPTVYHCMHSVLPIVWSDNIFDSSRELWEEARSFGLRHGWAQSSRGPRGVGGMLTLARSDENLSHLELRDKHSKMAWLSQVALVGMSRCLPTKLIRSTESQPQLTQREITVLRWTADGKTSWEISEILGISERTVNFHINNALSKFGVPNKIAATVKALVLGIL